jgi:hypothetical protein
VVLHPQKGILLIEVKSGKIEYRDRRLLQTNTRTGESFVIDPVGQLRASKHKLIDLLKKTLPRDSFCLIGYAIWFPTFPLSGTLPPDMLRDFTGDANDLIQTSTFLENAYQYWINDRGGPKLSGNDFQLILNTLCGEFCLAPSLKSQFQFQEQAFVRLTNEQARVFDFLEDQPRATISGAAGTGKTLLAMEKCRRLADRREPTVYLCFNRQLRQFLQTRFEEHPWLQIHTYHSLAQSLVPPCRDLNELELRFSEWMLDYSNVFPFQHVVVDEGQDFSEEWLDLLELRNPDTLYIFYDKHQNLFQFKFPAVIEHAECRLTLTRNCRNTRQIGRTSLSLLRLPADRLLADAVEGEKPVLFELPDLKTANEKVGTLVRNFVHQTGCTFDEVAILTLQTTEKSAFTASLHTWGIPLSENFEKGKATFTTARKYKGLEASLVILVDFDASALNDPGYRNLVYVASSRAKHALYWIAINPQEADYIQALTIDLSGRRLKANRQTFQKQFFIQIQ